MDGQSTWYHVGLELPSTGYEPTTGQWNWLVEWHVDQHTESFPGWPVSTAIGIYTDYPVVSGKVGQHPHLVLRLAGGATLRPMYESHIFAAPLMYDHWYSLTFHFVWSASARLGLAEWFVDGKLVVSRRLPTLFSNPDGTESYNGFGIYNYHLSCPWPSTVYFNQVEYGQTRAAIGA